MQASTHQGANLWQAALLARLEKAANNALATDPTSFERLTAHSGRLLAFHLTAPRLSIYLLIVEEGVELYHVSEAQADVTVTAAAIDLAAIFFNWQNQPSLIGSRVRIDGNRELLQAIQSILSGLAVDWGSLLSPLLGDNIAQQVDYGSRRLLSWLGTTGRQLGQQLNRYLQEDSGLLALRRQVYEFCQDVDELRYDVDRLDARIRRLQQKRDS